MWNGNVMTSIDKTRVEKILRVGGQHQVEAACSAALTFCFSKTSNMSYLQKWIVLVKQNTSGITNVDSYSHVFLYYQGKLKSDEIP